MSRGENLVQALDGEKKTIPPLYRAVVEAGARSGRLPVALEGLARYVRGYSEARAAIGLALWYPVLVLSLAYALFVGPVWKGLPHFVEAFEALGLKISAPMRWLTQVGELAPYWWPIGPILLAALAIAWVRSGTAARFKGAPGADCGSSPGCGRCWPTSKPPISPSLLGLLLRARCDVSVRLGPGSRSHRRPAAGTGCRPVGPGDRPRASRPRQALDALDKTTFLPMLRWVLATGQAAGFAGRGSSQSRRYVPQACQLPGRETLCALAHDPAWSESAGSRPCSMDWHCFYL